MDDNDANIVEGCKKMKEFILTKYNSNFFDIITPSISIKGHPVQIKLMKADEPFNQIVVRPCKQHLEKEAKIRH